MAKEKYSEDEEIRKAKEEFFGKIKKALLTYFEPIAKPTGPDVVFMSSREIFENLQRLFPSKLYQIDDVALWLDQTGFIFIDTGVMRLEWILRVKKQTNEK